MSNPPNPPSNANPAGSTPQKIVSQFAADPDMVELVQMFVDEMPQRVRTIQDQWQSHSFTDLRRTAHQIKGASGGYGFPLVGQVAAKLEQALTGVLDRKTAEDLAALQQQVDALVSVCNRVSVK